jgi:pimeloyl-ACP methyl ester carboxylesterase
VGPEHEVGVVAANGWRFTVRAAGPADGEPVVLLHGFPETSAMWVPTMTVLAAAGYRCVAPDQRGYSPGARPAEVSAYDGAELVADVLALADALGWSRFHLVGHDWGAAVGWRTAIADPNRLASLTVLSVPHYRAFAEASWSDPDEADYRRFLELVVAPEGAAERVLARDDFATFRAGWVFHDPAEIEATLSVLRAPGAFTAALAWYRAGDAHRRYRERPPDPVDVPTLLLWGTSDPYVRPAALTRAERIPVRDYRRVDLDAGHWLVQQRPQQVQREILAQLRRHGLGPSTAQPRQGEPPPAG